MTTPPLALPGSAAGHGHGEGLGARLRHFAWSPAGLWLDVLLMFFFLNNISFIWAPNVTSGRIVLAGLLLVHRHQVWRDWRALVRMNWPWMVLFLLLVVHVILVTTLSDNGDRVQLSRFLNFALFVVLGSVVYAAHVRHDAMRLARIVALATLVQSVMVFISYVSPAYRVWLTTVVVQGGNIPLTSNIQAPGFSNSSGAALSLLQMLGVFAALYVSRLERRGMRSLLYAVVACVNAASTMLIGRTGLMMSIVAIAGFLLSAIGQRGLIRLAAGLVVAAIAGVIWGDDLLAYLDRVNPSLAETLARSMSVLIAATADPSLIDLATQPIPPLSTATVIGTGRVIDPFGNASGNDSGYIQTYFAAGLIAAVTFYVTWLTFILRYVIRSQHRGLLGLLVLIMMLVEFKEPFVFKYGLPFVLLSLALCETDVRMRQREPVHPDSPHASPAATT